MKLVTPGRPTRGRRRLGASAVEAALVLPMVIMFLFGILEYGRYIMTLQIMTNAAREGAHYAKAHTQPVTIAGVTNGNTTADVTAKINKALGGASYLSGQTVQIYASDAQGNNIGPWTDTQVGESVCVRITGDYRVLMGGMLFLPTTIPVVAQAVMRSESN
jgi:Flp pilus assembly protein TadG